MSYVGDGGKRTITAEFVSPVLRAEERRDVLSQVLAIIRISNQDSNYPAVEFDSSTSIRDELDSLELIRMVVICEDNFGVELSYDDLIAIDTVADIAKAIESTLKENQLQEEVQDLLGGSSDSQ